MGPEATTVAHKFDVGCHQRHPPSQVDDEGGTAQVDTAALERAMERHFHCDEGSPVQSEEARNVRGAECRKVGYHPSSVVGHEGGLPALAREYCLLVGDSEDGRSFDAGGLHSARLLGNMIKRRRLSMTMRDGYSRCSLLLSA